MKYWKYLKYIIRHKYYVAQECFKYGLYWRGIMHDMSKLLPSEFFAYADYFYANGDERAFDMAWLKHQKRNDHHWQWWILNEDSGASKYMEMSWDAMTEMICDWVGAGKAMGKVSPKDDPFYETRAWYRANQNKIRLNITTRQWVKFRIGIIKVMHASFTAEPRKTV